MRLPLEIGVRISGNRHYLLAVLRRLLPVLLVLLPACSEGDSLSTSEPNEYYYASPEQEPHPGIAEGKPVVEVDGVTFYACPPVAVGQVTPLIEHTCLMPGDEGFSRYGNYSTLEPSVDCDNGKKATDAAGLGWGFVGSPLIAQDETDRPAASPDRAAVLDCLRQAASRSVPGGAWGKDRSRTSPKCGFRTGNAPALDRRTGRCRVNRSSLSPPQACHGDGRRVVPRPKR